MDNIQNILSDNLQFKQLRRFQSSLRVASILKHKWDVIVGKLASQLKYGYVRGPLLVLYSENPIWNTEISNFQPILLKQIQDKTSITSITNIKVLPHKPEKMTDKKSIQNNTGTLLEKIRQKNQYHQSKGEQLCTSCRLVYTQNKTCIFCTLKK